MEANTRYATGDKREAHVEITPSGRIVRLTLHEDMTAADVKIWSELPCGIPSDVLGLEMDERKLANHEVVLKTAPAEGDIALKLTLTPWWLKFVSACMKGDEEQVRVRINIKMSSVSKEERIFVAAFTAAQRGDHRLLFSIIAGRKIDFERKVKLSGRTLLHAAIFGGTISCVTNVLVNRGGSLLETPDLTGESPIQLAHRLHGDGKILQLLNMYLELHRRESSADIWSLFDEQNVAIANSSPCDSPEDTTEKERDGETDSYELGSHESGTVGCSAICFEGCLAADNSQHSAKEHSSALRTSNGDGRLERTTLQHNEIDATRDTRNDPQDTGAQPQGLETHDQEFNPNKLRKPKVPTLRERRKLSMQKRNVRAPVIQSATPAATITTTTTITSQGDVTPVTDSFPDSTRLAVQWKEKQSDSPALKTDGTPRQRRKGMTVDIEQLPLLKLQLKHDLHASQTVESVPRDLSSGGNERVGSAPDALPSGKEFGKSSLLPAIHSNKRNNACNSPGRQKTQKEFHSGASVKPTLPATPARQARLQAGCSSASVTRQRKQSQPIFGSPTKLAPEPGLGKSRRRSLSASPFLCTRPPSPSGFVKNGVQYGTSANVQHCSRDASVRKAWWRSSISSEGSPSEGSADEDWGQIRHQSPRKVQQPASCSERKDEYKARMYRSKSDPMRGDQHADHNIDKESRRKLSIKAYEQWLRRKDEQALNLDEERIRAVRETQKLSYTRKKDSLSNKARLGSL